MLNLMYTPDALKKLYNVSLLTREAAQKVEEEFQKKYKDYLNIEDNGNTVYSKSNCELSKGCQACKRGKWLCLFVGYNCNCQCPFCPQPKQANFTNVFDEPNLTSHGTTNELKYYLSTDNIIEGVSYSGGEPLLYLDKVTEIGNFIKENKPELYQWLYTNGILLDEDKLKMLKNIGLNEIRLDLAATAFSKEIINKIPMIKKYVERVTVEIPAIPTIRTLMEDGLLDELVNLGVTQLNLSEMTINQEVNMELYGKNNILIAHKGFYKALTLFESEIIYYQILEYAINKKLDILINHCNWGAKFVQIFNKQRLQGHLQFNQ